MSPGGGVMKLLRTLVVFNQGNLIIDKDWEAIHKSYDRSIQSIDHPKGSGGLTLRKKKKRPDGQWDRNGVGYLRLCFLEHMTGIEGWKAEADLDLGKDPIPPDLLLYPDLQSYQEKITSEFGGFDFVSTAPGGTHVAIEWETGNISSSHRSMNKLAIALANEKIQVGVLIVPSRDLYKHLTDRIGNIGELSGYLSMWKDLGVNVKRGLLAISVVEHDDLTEDPSFSYLPKGNDGRAHEGNSKRE